MKALVLAVLAFVSSAMAAPADDYRQSRAALAKHDDGFGMLDATPGASAALQRFEMAVQAWAAEWFDHHPSLDLADFAKAGKMLDADLDAAAAELDPHSILVRVNHGQLGTVFILSDRSGRHETVWDIADAGAIPAIPNGQELSAWNPERAQGDCRNKSRDWARTVCGPLFGEISVLPPANGRARFYVNGLYGQAAGATGGQQFSVWTWDGSRATAVLVRLYAVMADQEGPKVSGNTISIPAKGSFKTMFACGACIGRELKIVIRLDAAKDAERVKVLSLTPELDLIDELYSRVLNKKPIAGVASPAAASRVAKEVIAAKPGDFPLGMIDSWTLSRRSGQKVLCLNSDNDEGSHLFTFAEREGHLKIVDVRTTDSQCQGPGARN